MALKSVYVVVEDVIEGNWMMRDMLWWNQICEDNWLGRWEINGHSIMILITSKGIRLVFFLVQLSGIYYLSKIPLLN